MATTDKPEFEGIYVDKGNLNILYEHRIEEALDIKNESNVKIILEIIDDALKTNNQEIIENIFNAIANSSENYTKIYEILKQRNNDLVQLINTLNRLHSQRTKDRGIRNKITGFNTVDMNIIRNSPYTSDIYQIIIKKDLDINVFNLSNSNSPFYNLKLMQANFTKDIKGLEYAKQKSELESNPLSRFRDALFGK